MTRDEIRLKMALLAAGNESFRRLHDFFKGLATLDKVAYLAYCRARMPHIADVFAEKVGASPLVQALKQAPVRSDEEVVALSRRLLEATIEAVEKK